MTTALITGASSGIGLELARVFARNGHDLVLVARSEDKLRELGKELEEGHGVRAAVLAADLTERAAPAEIHDRLETDGVAVEVLVNNAGFGDFGPFVESEWGRVAGMIDLNVTALTHLARLFLPAMVERRRGRILNVASTAAFQPGPLMAVYYATKSYVLHFSEAIANELSGTGVTVTALCPGPTASGFQAEADLHGSRLVETFPLPSSAEVAEYGYRALMKGKTVAIHGVANRLMATSIRFTPRKLVPPIVRWASEKVD